MARPVSAIRNLGPASDAAFARAGLHSAQAVIDLGADAAYARLLASGARPHFIAFYALAMGLQGRPWNDCRGEEKAALRTRFDRLVAQASGKHCDMAAAGGDRPEGKTGARDAARDADISAEIDAALDAIGVRRP
ncbi:MAG: TfoX/Sxy family DNA transformation protein [Pseudomonadota bacterium]